MTVVFKHMTRENAIKLSRGEIRIGSFAYYHESEHSEAIRDAKEGLTVGRTGNVVLSSEQRSRKFLRRAQALPLRCRNARSPQCAKIRLVC
jgi:hypothetical protein